MARWSLFSILCAASVAGASCHSSPATISSSVAPNKVGAATTECPSAFGLSDIIANLRGGEVIGGHTSADVDAIILKAGSDQKLVVVDFTATW